VTSGNSETNQRPSVNHSSHRTGNNSFRNDMTTIITIFCTENFLSVIVHGHQQSDSSDYRTTVNMVRVSDGCMWCEGSSLCEKSIKTDITHQLELSTSEYNIGEVWRKLDVKRMQRSVVIHATQRKMQHVCLSLSVCLSTTQLHWWRSNIWRNAKRKTQID